MESFLRITGKHNPTLKHLPKVSISCCYFQPAWARKEWTLWPPLFPQSQLSSEPPSCPFQTSNYSKFFLSSSALHIHEAPSCIKPMSRYYKWLCRMHCEVQFYDTASPVQNCKEPTMMELSWKEVSQYYDDFSINHSIQLFQAWESWDFW